MCSEGNCDDNGDDKDGSDDDAQTRMIHARLPVTHSITPNASLVKNANSKPTS